MDTKKYICIDIGGTKVLGVLFKGDEIICKVKKKTKAHEGAEKLNERIISLVEEILENSKMPINEISAIAAGAAGIIDEEKGVIIYSPNLPWLNYNIKSIIEKKFNIPFFVGNDVNVGILGEWKYGAGKNIKNLIGIFVGTGIGGGLILDNKLYTGSKHAAGELGHIIVNTEGPYCNCGQRGCLEAYASKTAMLREIKNAIERGEKSILADLLEDNLNSLRSKVLKKGIEENDELTKDVVDRAMYYLAAGTGNIINIFDPEKIILGGGVIEALGEYAMKRFKSYLGKFAMVNIIKNVEISKAQLGDYSVIYGAKTLIELK